MIVMCNQTRGQSNAIPNAGKKIAQRVASIWREVLYCLLPWNIFQCQEVYTSDKPPSATGTGHTCTVMGR